MPDCSKAPAPETPEKQFYESEAGMTSLWQNASSGRPTASEQTVNQIGAARVGSQTPSVRTGSSQRGVSSSTVWRALLEWLGFESYWFQLVQAHPEGYKMSKAFFLWTVQSFTGRNCALGTYLACIEKCSSEHICEKQNVLFWCGSRQCGTPVCPTERVHFLYFFEDKGKRFGFHCTKHHFW
jgi:hypothetical protein